MVKNSVYAGMIVAIPLKETGKRAVSLGVIRSLLTCTGIYRQDQDFRDNGRISGANPT